MIKPKVSIIIPAYNAIKYLPETVESVLKQSFTDFELLIINDGSSDNTVEWVSSISDSRVRLISQENKGLSGARNTGITSSKGEYISFLDADDIWEPTKIEKQVYKLDNDPTVGLVYTWVKYFYEDIESVRLGDPDAEGNVLKAILEANVVMCGSNAMVRRFCFEEVGKFDENLTSIEDWDMWIRIASKYSFAVVKEALVYYRQHNSNMSKNYEMMIQNFNKVFERAFQLVPPDLFYIKEKAYGRVYLHLAWIAWDRADYKISSVFLEKATHHCPEISKLHDFQHLNRVSSARNLLGPWGYKIARTVARQKNRLKIKSH